MKNKKEQNQVLKQNITISFPNLHHSMGSQQINQARAFKSANRPTNFHSLTYTISLDIKKYIDKEYNQLQTRIK